MEKNLLIVGSRQYGEVVKEIAESMKCFDKVSFLDDEREDSVGRLEDYEQFYPEYKYAIAAFDDGQQRIDFNRKLKESLYIVPQLVSPDSTVFPSAGLMDGCIIEPGVVIESQGTVGIGTIVGARCVIEDHSFVGDGSWLKAGTIVKKNSMIAMLSETEYGSVLFTSLKQ